MIFLFFVLSIFTNQIQDQAHSGLSYYISYGVLRMELVRRQDVRHLGQVASVVSLACFQRV